jgi:hypothetical protein
MAGRSEIIDGSDAAIYRNGLVYSEVPGWIDLGHARGDDIQFLLELLWR